MVPFMIVLILMLCSVDALAGEPSSHEQRIHFTQNNHGVMRTVIDDHIKGRNILDYLVFMNQGQQMNIHMVGNHHSNYFNVLAPHQDGLPLFNGAIHGNEYKGVAEYSGDYRIRVYLMRNAARRKEIAYFRLDIRVSKENDGVSSGASGNIPCAQFSGQPTRACHFKVRRDDEGGAMVTIRKPNGDTRVILFHQGVPSLKSQGKHSIALKVRREYDLYFIRVGQERYEIPEAVITGG